MIHQSWITECLEMLKIFDKIMNFITKAIENRKLELIAGRQVKILRSFFQENSLAPFLFIAMTPLNYILKKCMKASDF